MKRTPATLTLADTDSLRWVAVRARDGGRLLAQWRVPAVRSPLHAAMLVRRHHLPDLLALAELNGFRVVDRRGEVQ